MSSKKVALITGGSRGIGYGIAAALAKEGFDLAINGVRPEIAVTDVLTKLAESGRDVIYCQGDIGSPEQREGILDKVRSHFGCLNVLINNAGVAPKERKDILEASAESFDYVLKTNLQGPYFLTQAVANWLVGQKDNNNGFQGCIITVGSISAIIASVNRGEYCIAKAGLAMMTRLFAARLGAYDIPVYEIQPGIIRTDMTAAVTDKYDRLIADGLCVQERWGLPEDVGKAAAALARGDLPYSTGQVIMVDGGLTIPRL